MRERVMRIIKNDWKTLVTAIWMILSSYMLFKTMAYASNASSNSEEIVSLKSEVTNLRISINDIESQKAGASKKPWTKEEFDNYIKYGRTKP